MVPRKSGDKIVFKKTILKTKCSDKIKVEDDRAKLLTGIVTFKLGIGLLKFGYFSTINNATFYWYLHVLWNP